MNHSALQPRSPYRVATATATTTNNNNNNNINDNNNNTIIKKSAPIIPKGSLLGKHPNLQKLLSSFLVNTRHVNEN